MVRKLMLGTAAFTSVSSVGVALHALVWDDGSLMLNLLKILLSVVIMAIGSLTWFYSRSLRAHASEIFYRVMLFGSMMLLLLGAAGVVWTYYLAHLTGDFEAWAVLINTIIIGQGVLTLCHLVYGTHEAQLI